MLFTSPVFLFVFLPLFLTLYYCAPRATEARNAVALAGSVVFFAWGEPVFVFALMAGTFVDYRISRWIEPNSPVAAPTRRRLLTFAIVLDVAALVASKYLDFIVGQLMMPLAPFLHLELTKPNLPLLLGISFITFHRISYLVDSYKGRAVPPRGFMDCAL